MTIGKDNFYTSVFHWVRLWALVFVTAQAAGTTQTSGKITLLDHQQKVLDYLTSHPSIKGILLFHELGSGKTITSIAYGETQKEYKKVVFVPKVLKAHWQHEIKKFGVKDPKDYIILSYNEPEDIKKIATIDLGQSVLIIDEVQKLVEKIRFSMDENLISLYWRLSLAYKVLALSATPIYNDAADVAFVGNLILAKKEFPFHPDKFRSQYTEIRTATSLFRGYFNESKLTLVTAPIFTSMLGASLLEAVSIWALPALAVAGAAGIHLINEWFPIQSVSFRRFKAAKLAGFANHHISFFEARKQSTTEFPSHSVSYVSVEYTPAQVDFFLDYTNGNLAQHQLEMLLRDSQLELSDEMRKINSYHIQQIILNDPSSGREIGNFSLEGEDGIEVSKKFLSILAKLDEIPGKVAVYSSFYHNGLRLFAEFLDENGYKDQYTVVEYDFSPARVAETLASFNYGQKRILLIHPEITEGISLRGVEQFHILEPVKSSALEKQIIGRSTRYRSHSHLPKGRQHVHVFVWNSKVTYSTLGLPSAAGITRRNSWRRNFSELNPSLWTGGIAQLDRAYFRKAWTPDEATIHSKDIALEDMTSFRDVVKEYSIESGNEAPLPSSFSPETKVQSLYAVPLTSLGISFNAAPYSMYSISDQKEISRVDFLVAPEFNIEIPHNNFVNFGFLFRFDDERGLFTDEDNEYRSLATVFGLYGKLHYEPSILPKFSLYYKGEADLGVFMGLGGAGPEIATKQVVGLQYLLAQGAYGFSAEVGGIARLRRDIFLSNSDTAEELLGDAAQSFTTVYSLAPVVTVSFLSSYF